MGGAKFAAGKMIRIYAIGYIVCLYIPILLLPLFSFNDAIFIAFPMKGFTLKWYSQMAEKPGVLDLSATVSRSGVSVAVVSTALGTLAALAMSRHRLPGQQLAVLLISLPVIIPGIVLAISLLSLASYAQVPLNLVTVAIGHVLLCTPMVMMIMVARLGGTDPSLEEASMDLGETAFMTFWRVTFPIAIPGIMASLLLAFTISFDEFVLANFLSGTEPTLPVYIWGQLRFPERLPGVLALGSCILLFSFVLIALVGWLQREQRQDSIKDLR